MKFRMALVAVVCCIMSLLPAVGSDTLAPPEADQQLKAMETKFFVHDFSKEPQEYRVQRLEKFVFGQSNTGGMDDRLGKLTKVVDMHKSIAQKPATPPAQAQQVAQNESKYSRELDDRTAQSAHDKMKWVEDYRPRPATAYSRPLESVVPEDQKLSEEERELEKALRDPTAMAVAREVKTAPNPITHTAINIPASLSGLRQAYDPAIFGDLPPDHHARMLTRVSWCEQHVFGHTFPQLHLPERLHQLSAELLPNQHLSDLELMDHLDLIVREVVMQQHPPIAYGK